MALQPKKLKYIISTWVCPYCGEFYYDEDSAYWCCGK